MSTSRSGTLHFEGSRYVHEDYFKRVEPERKPRKGDILYTVTGSFGIPIIVDTNTEFCVQRHIAILKPSTHMSNGYLNCVMASHFVYSQAAECATGIAQKTVPLSGLRQIALPVPPLAEQKRIVTKVDELMALCDAWKPSSPTPPENKRNS